MNVASKAFVGMLALAACAKPPVSGTTSLGAAAPVVEGLDPIKPPAGVTVTHRV